MILDRPRHQNLINEVRSAGARIKLITDGDVAGAILAARPDTGVDLLMGIGGTPEGVIAACAIRCLGGEILGRFTPQSDLERERALESNIDLKKIYTSRDLVKGEDIFFAATGITDGELLRGVRYHHNWMESHSIVMRSRSKTIRTISTEHPYRA